MNYILAASEEMEAVYVEGEMVFQCEATHGNDIFDLVKQYGPVDTYEYKYVNQDWFDTVTEFPKLMEDVQWD